MATESTSMIAGPVAVVPLWPSSLWPEAGMGLGPSSASAKRALDEPVAVVDPSPMLAPPTRGFFVVEPYPGIFSRSFQARGLRTLEAGLRQGHRSAFVNVNDSP